MPLTTLDPTAALVVIDLQKGTTSLPGLDDVQGIIERAARLAETFRRRGLPVVLVNVAARAPGRTDATFNLPPTPDWTELVPEMTPQPGDHRVTKQCFGAFLGSDLDGFLRKRGVTQIFLAGVSTSIGVESTARSAYDLGYNAVFVTDAMTDRDADSHRHSVEKIFPRLGESTTTDVVLAKLQAGV